MRAASRQTAEAVASAFCASALELRPALAVDAAPPARLAEDRAEHPEAVAEGLEVALAGDPVLLVARHLGDLHPGAGDAEVDQRLDLEAGHVERDEGQAARPEGVVAVAEVGEVGAVQEVGGAAEDRRCRACAGRVMSALPPPSRKREPLAKSAPASSASTKRGISAGSAEPSASSMTTRLPVTAAKPVRKASPLPRPLWVRTRMLGVGAAGGLDRVVLGVAVDEDHLVQALGQLARARGRCSSPRSSPGRRR